MGGYVLHFAFEYLDRGWPVIPVKAKTPAIAWSAYQKMRPPLAQVNESFGANTAAFTEQQGRTLLRRLPDARRRHYFVFPSVMCYVILSAACCCLSAHPRRFLTLLFDVRKPWWCRTCSKVL